MSSQGRFKRAVALLGAVAALGVAVAGCGAGSDTTTAAAPQLTKAQFVKQAAALCRKLSEEKEATFFAAIKGEGGKGLFSASNGELEKLASRVLPLYAEAISQLGRLKPPSKDKAQVQKILDEYKAALKEAKADPSTVLGTNPFLKGDEAAAAYGFSCSI